MVKFYHTYLINKICGLNIKNFYKKFLYCDVYATMSLVNTSNFPLWKSIDSTSFPEEAANFSPFHSRATVSSFQTKLRQINSALQPDPLSQVSLGGFQAIMVSGLELEGILDITSRNKEFIYRSYSKINLWREKYFKRCTFHKIVIESDFWVWQP